MSENYEVSTKLYKVDWKFLIRHCLDVNYWKNIYSIYDYDGLKLSLQLCEINILNKQLEFRLLGNYTNNDEVINDFTFVYIQFDDDHYNKEVLDNKLLSSVLALIGYFERGQIRNSDEYAIMDDASDKEVLNLKDNAKAHLDDLNIDDEDVRSAYIDKYVEDHYIDYASEFVDENAYTVLPSQYLAACLFFSNENRYNEYKKLIENKAISIDSDLEEIRVAVKKIQSPSNIIEMKDEDPDKEEEIN